MSSEFIEIEEKTIDEAIEKACREFGVPREKLNIEIISGESGGFLGLFSKKAKIRASLLALDIDFSFSEKPQEKSEPKVKKDVPKDKIEIKTEHKKKPEKEIIAEKPPVRTEQEVVYIPASPNAIKAQEILEGILQRISPEYHANVKETQEKIILGIEGDESGLLIGKRGQNLDALQYILNKAVNKIDGEHKMVLIDSGEYRKRREEFLLGLAEKIKRKVKKTRKPVSLANMNAHDRRIIHLVMQEDESLVTQSRGEGKFRKIVILPAKTGGNRRARDKKRS
ncbi:MAG: Jag N-terminal domain-containing protein [Deltaproteobacteria bacterium]|nr:Jag N-terminal domain-containing protein [Deltaproteobacteria bacterium]